MAAALLAVLPASIPLSTAWANPAVRTASVQEASGFAGSSSTAVQAMSKADVLALLYKIYDQSYRFGDAVNKLPAANWNFRGRKRDTFYEDAAAVRASVTDLRKPWDEFYKQPDDADLGRETLKAVHTVTTRMDKFMASLAETPGASELSEFKPMQDAVVDSEDQLESYVNYLRASAKTSTSPAAAAQPSAPASKAAEHAETSSTAGATAPSSSAPQPPATAQPAAEAAASAPSSASNAAPSPSAPASESAPPQPPVMPVAMAPADVQALLYKIYMATFRISDLAASLQPDKWNLSSQDRAAFTAKLDALRASLTAEEKAHSDFYNHPDDAGLGQMTASDLQALNPKLDGFLAALSGTPGSSSTREFKSAEDDLTVLDQHLDPYVAYLVAKSQPAATAGGAALETEKVSPGENVAPLSSGVVESAPENQQQLKMILYKAYEPAFRIKDLLSQEHPDQWHASDADRTAFKDASQTLLDRIADLQKWRDQLDSHPESLEAAFETYAALGKLVGPADRVGRLVGQYGNPRIGAEYGQRAEQVEESRDQVEPYLDYLLRHYDHTSGAIEHDFIACENELTYAMRPSIHQAVAMKNVNPVFQGRGRRAERSTHSASRKTSPPQKKEKKSSSSATATPSH